MGRVLAIRQAREPNKWNLALQWGESSRQETQAAALAKVSQACFGLRPNPEEEHTRCPFRSCLQADRAHVFWNCNCPERPVERRIPASAILQAGLGWPLTALKFSSQWWILQETSGVTGMHTSPAMPMLIKAITVSTAEKAFTASQTKSSALHRQNSPTS